MGLAACLASARYAAPQRWSAWCLLAFGLAMIASAVWQHRPWLPDMPVDAFADRMHSWAAQLAGVAFVAVVSLRIAQRWATEPRLDPVDVAALGAALLAPLVIALGGAWPGAAQRVMFALAYVWIAREAAALTSG